MKCVWVLFFHWSLSGAEWFKIEKGPDTVVTALGSGIVLPCSLTPTMSAVDMEVKWSRQALGKKLVHHYMNKEDKNEDQDRSYRGRTALFKEELQYGNTSLLLKDVTVSDPGQYTCEVQGKGAYDKITVKVIVEGIGTNPNITEESTDSPGTRLLCETKGWKSKPDLKWFSSEGTKLTEGDSKSQEVNGLYTVRHRITAHGSGTYSCRVKQYPMMEMEIDIPDSSQPKDTGHSFTSGQSKTTVILIITGIVLMLMVGVDI